MKKLQTLVSALLVLCTLGALLCACHVIPAETTPGGTTPPTTPPTTTPPTTTPPTTTAPEASFTVSLSTSDDNCWIIGDSSLTVKGGETATFRVMLRRNYVLEPEIGTYDAIGNYYTIENVSEDLTITLTPIYAVNFQVTVDGGDKTVNGVHVVVSGESLALKADSSKGEFIGWSSGNTLADGGKLISSEASYVFTPSGNVTIYANYAGNDTKYLLYDMNGGKTNTGAATYMQALDTSFFTAPNSLNDKKIFTRAGYALIEYNTKADGTGTGYSLGSKIKLSGDVTTLYCIWAKATEERFFTTTQVLAQNLSKKNVTGVAITGYSGTDSTVVIPETIGGKPVVQINSNAFRNRSMTTLVLTNNLLKVQANAFTGCGNLETVYFSDSIVSIPDNAFDATTYKNFKNFYLNAIEEPRYCNTYDGNYRVKWDRLMEGSDGDMIVYVAGSSALHGVATEYMEALLDGKYTFVNYGTVRTTNALFYLEAVSKFTDAGDIVIWGPENSEFQFGCNKLTFKLFRDLEGSLNLFRYVDISNYQLIFSAYSDYQNRRKNLTPLTYDHRNNIVDENGDFQDPVHKMYNQTSYTISPFAITLSNMKSTAEIVNSGRDNSAPIPLNTHATFVKKILGEIRATGAKAYFGFCTIDDGALVAPGNTAAGQAAYDQMIRDIFGIETLGTVSDYIYATKYMYQAKESSFHVNDYGRALNTYQLYKDLCAKLGLTPKAYRALGTKFPGCNFE